MVSKRVREKRARKIKHTRVIEMCVTAGFFLGIGLGAMMNNLLPVLVLSLLVSAGIGYYIDRKHGIDYTKPKNKRS